jgi:hypothetical protein
MADATPFQAPGTCLTCMHWGQRVSYWNTPTHRTCASPYILYGEKVQQALEFSDAAVVEAYKGWGMLTGPDFGCIHWEAGGTANPPGDHPAMQSAHPDAAPATPPQEPDTPREE